MIKYFSNIYFTSGAVVAFTVFDLTTIGSTNAFSDLMYKSRVLPLLSGTCWCSVGKNTAVSLCVAAFVVSHRFTFDVNISVFFF